MSDFHLRIPKTPTRFLRGISAYVFGRKALDVLPYLDLNSHRKNQLILNRVLKAIRISIGAFILLIIGTNIVIPQVLPVSGKSIVNAKLEWIRTPIQGNVHFRSINIGDTVSRNGILGKVTNERADDNFLNQLNLQKSAIETAKLNIIDRQTQLKGEQQKLEQRLFHSLADLKTQTAIQIDTIQHELALALTEAESLENKIFRYKAVNREQAHSGQYAVVSRSQLDQVQTDLSETEVKISAHTNTLALLEQRLESATSGHFDSQNAPQERLQLLDIERGLASIQSELSSLMLKAEAIDQKITERKAHVALISEHKLISNASGIVWDIAFSEGSYVHNGDSLIAIADTDTLTVECIFHQRYLDNIEAGDHATVNLMGSNRKITGKVASITIRDHVKSNDLSAFNFGDLSSDEFKVIVELDRNIDVTPLIGQRAKVIISGSEHNLVSRMLSMLNR